MRTLRASFFRRSSTCFSISLSGSDIETRRSRVPRVSTLAAILPRNSFVCFWCEGRDSNPHASRRQLLRLVRLPIPPPSPPSGSRKSGKKTTYYNRRCLFGFDPDVGRPLRKLPRCIAAAAQAAPRADRDHLPLRAQRG